MHIVHIIVNIKWGYAQSTTKLCFVSKTKTKKNKEFNFIQ